jgi:hypothetical protein
MLGAATEYKRTLKSKSLRFGLPIVGGSVAGAFSAYFDLPRWHWLVFSVIGVYVLVVLVSRKWVMPGDGFVIREFQPSSDDLHIEA